MENQHFWAFFVIALIAGGAITLAVSNATMTGHAFNILDLFGDDNEDKSVGYWEKSVKYLIDEDAPVDPEEQDFINWIECEDCECKENGEPDTLCEEEGCTCGCFKQIIIKGSTIWTKQEDSKCIHYTDPIQSGDCTCMTHRNGLWYIDFDSVCNCMKPNFEECKCKHEEDGSPSETGDWLGP